VILGGGGLNVKWGIKPKGDLCIKIKYYKINGAAS